MRINNNLMAMNTTRQMGVNNAASSKSMEKLSSGYRINKAGDDAAGLAISEKMRGQIRGLNQASKNSQEGVSLIQTAEAALGQTHDILQRMRELAVQASTGTLQNEDRGQIDKEFQALKGEVDDIATKSQFNKMNLLDGTFGASVTTDDLTAVHNNLGVLTAGVEGVASVEINGTKASTYTFAANATTTTDLDVTDSAGNVVTIKDGLAKPGAQVINIKEFGLRITTTDTFDPDVAALAGDVTVAGSSVDIQTGANQADVLSLSIKDMSSSGLQIDGSSTTSAANAANAITSIENAIKSVSDERAKLGATQNRLEYKMKNLDSSAENLQSAESRIRDVDMAKEMVEYTKNDILNQAAQAMLAKANQAPQGVLQLLR